LTLLTTVMDPRDIGRFEEWFDRRFGLPIEINLKHAEMIELFDWLDEYKDAIIANPSAPAEEAVAEEAAPTEEPAPPLAAE
ncbi:hypothetical protein A2U01_0070497, partial [Trifolium medium]|nr:hypothetical protein [Trifolium medium]